MLSGARRRSGLRRRLVTRPEDDRRRRRSLAENFGVDRVIGASPVGSEARAGFPRVVRSRDDQREVVLQLGATGRTSSSLGKKVSDGADLAKAGPEP